MLTAIEDETRRLSQFVYNFLHTTLIDAAAFRPTIEPVDVSDLIGSTLRRVEKRLSGHRVHTALASGLPMVPLDFVLVSDRSHLRPRLLTRHSWITCLGVVL